MGGGVRAERGQPERQGQDGRDGHDEQGTGAREGAAELWEHDASLTESLRGVDVSRDTVSG